MSEEMTGAEIVLRALSDQGVEHIFGYPGGAVLPIVRSVAEIYGSRPGETAALIGSFLMVGVYQAICVSSATLLTAQASNALAARMSAQFLHYPITWLGWAKAGVVPGLVSMAMVPWIVYRLYPPAVRSTPEAAAFARRELTASLGKNPKDWSWGLLHTVAPQHPVLGGPSVPGLIRRLVNPAPIPVAGSGSIVDATAWDASTGSFAVTTAPSMRMVVDLQDLDRSTWVDLTGSSGHPGSVHYMDQFQAWADGRTFPWPFTSGAETAAADQRLTLRPAS